MIITAKVIVDVPVSRTNRPFDYRVPDWIQPLIAVGSRVVVPFWRHIPSHRKQRRNCGRSNRCWTIRLL